MKEIEEEANRIVYKNLNIEILYPTKEELKDLTYRSKIEIEGQVRIVNIPGVDICACCAPHVDRTGRLEISNWWIWCHTKAANASTMLGGSRALTRSSAERGERGRRFPHCSVQRIQKLPKL